MDARDRSALISFALAGLLLGALGHTSWFVAYSGLLFGFSVVIGLRRPPHIVLWILTLIAGAPVANLIAHVALNFNPSLAWYADAFLRTGGALLAVLPGVGAGLLYRRFSPRLRKSPA